MRLDHDHARHYNTMMLLTWQLHVFLCINQLLIMQGFLAITDKDRDVQALLLSNREKLNDLVLELLSKFDKDEKHCPKPGGYIA